MTKTNQHFDTIALHGGKSKDSLTNACATPLYQTAAYNFNDVTHAANLFGLKEEGFIYTRIGNPTTDVLEKRIAELEGGVGAVAFATGHAAIVASILNIAQQGDEIVSSGNLYGGTYNLFTHNLPRLGITTKFVDGSNPDNFLSAITEKTKAIFAEVIGNPNGDILDIETVAAIAHANGIPLIV